MNTTQILEQVDASDTMQELSALMSHLTAAIEARQCSYDLMGWQTIVLRVRERTAQIRSRVIH